MTLAIKFKRLSRAEKCLFYCDFNPLNAELNPIYRLLALLGAHHILHVSRIRVNAFKVYDAPRRPACTGTEAGVEG